MVATTPTKKPTPDGMKTESLDRIDLSTMTQSELYAISLCSSSAFDLRPTNDVVIPEIDRTIFNESAATRGQTHSRHRTNSSAVVGRRIRLPGHARASLAPSPNDSAMAEGKSVVNHLKRLISEAEAENPPADQPQPPSPTTTQRGNASEVTSGAAEIGIAGLSGERKRKRRSRKKTVVVENSGEFGNSPTQNSKPSPPAATQVGIGSPADMGVTDLSGARNRKRKRNEKQVVVVEDGGEIELEMINKNGVVVDLRALENGDQVFDEELKKRTIGLETEEEFLRFMGGLEGKWGSTRKKRRVVDSGEFSDALPVGWKLLLALKRQQYRPFLFCRRYIRFSLLLISHLYKSLNYVGYDE